MKLPTRTLTFLAAMSLAANLFGDPLEVGAPAPEVTATTNTGAELAFTEVYAKGPTLVFFYPKAHTGGCTAQVCNVRDHYAELQEQGIQVIGVSTDKVETQQSFSEKHELPYPLVADAEKTVVKAFGVSTVFGLADRQAYLVVDGKIVWRDTNAKPKSQAEDALAALAEYRKSNEG